MTKRAPRLDDVAAVAGVSPATVSRFLNNPSVVAEATAIRIREAVSSTGYIPNLNAGALASSRSRMISLLVPGLADSVFNDTMEAMVDQLSEAGSSVLVGLTGYDEHRMRAQIEAALSRRVEAIILTGIVSEDDMRARLRRSGTTVVETWGLPDDPIDVAVGFSHREAGAETARFVQGRGYRRPLLVVGASVRAERRAMGFEARWTADGGTPPPRLSVPVPSHFGIGRAAFRAIGGMAERPDVVVCGSDWVAQGIIVEAMAAGIRVPDQMAVIGFGNLRIAGDMRPTITSVDIDGGRIARAVMEVLKARTAGDPVNTRIDCGFRMIARESA